MTRWRGKGKCFIFPEMSQSVFPPENIPLMPNILVPISVPLSTYFKTPDSSHRPFYCYGVCLKDKPQICASNICFTSCDTNVNAMELLAGRTRLERKSSGSRQTWPELEAPGGLLSCHILPPRSQRLSQVNTVHLFFWM